MSEYTKKRKAVFFSLFYPFTHHGTSFDFYVAVEVKRLAVEFETVDVYSFSHGHDGQMDTPDNVRVHNFHPTVGWFDRLSIINLFFRSFFLKELQNLKNIYGKQLNISLFKAIAIYAVKSGKYYKVLLKLLKQIDFKDYDVCIYCYWNFEYALSAALLKNKFPIQLVVRTHSLDLYFDRMPEKYQPFKRFVFLKSDLFIFISENGMDYFFKAHQIPKLQQSNSILNRVGIENYLPRYKMEWAEVSLLSNAWIQPLKRIELLIQSLALINDISIRWIHIGDDSGIDPTRFTEIKRIAAEYLNGKPNIKYEFVGKMNIDEIYKLYYDLKINLFINLSTTEGTPVSMMEALSFGVPVIGTKVGGVPEIVTDGINGFLLPVDITAQEVASKIREYYVLPVERKLELSANALRVWDEKFNSEKNSNQLIEKIVPPGKRDLKGDGE